VFHHVWLLLLTSNFDLTVVIFFSFSFVWIWLIPVLEDGRPASPYYQSIYTEMFKSPVLWLNVVMGIAVQAVPIYAFFKYRQFFGGNPMHDVTYQQDRLKAAEKAASV